MVKITTQQIQEQKLLKHAMEVRVFSQESYMINLGEQHITYMHHQKTHYFNKKKSAMQTSLKLLL